MITLILFLCLAQQGNAPTTTPWQSPDHPARAEARPMLPEKTLLSSGYTSGTGEMPLAEAYRPAAEVPLGTIARICREDAQDQRCIYKGDYK
jgi:hypothetical protein